MIEGIKNTDYLSVDVHMLQMDYNESKIAELRQAFATKYGVPLKNISINFVPETVNEDGDVTSSPVTEIIENIQNPSFHLHLFDQYVKERDIHDVDMDVIRDIDVKVNAHLDLNPYIKYKPYKIKNIRWSNFASYGDNNFFDFTKMHGMVHLTSIPGNQGGKTTFAIHLIKFALFGKSDKMRNLMDVFNKFRPEATEAFVEVSMEIEGVDYVIKRTLTRPALKRRTEKSKVTQKVEFYRMDAGGLTLIENCEGESNTQTNVIIRESIGKMDDFDLVIAATASSISSMIEMGTAERTKLFSRWLGLLAVEEKETIAKQLWNKQIQPSLVSGRYNKETVSLEIGVYQEQIEVAETEIKSAKGDIDVSDKRIADLEKEKSELLQSKKTDIPSTSFDIDSINLCIKDKNKELEVKRCDIAEKERQFNEVKDVVFSEDDYKALVKKKENLQNDKHDKEIENAGIKTQIKGLDDSKKHIQGLLEKGLCPECGQAVTLTNQQGHLDEIQKERDRLIEVGVSNKATIDGLAEKITAVSNEITAMEENRKKVEVKNKLELNLVVLRSNEEKLINEIKDYEKIRDDINKSSESLAFNARVDGQIRNIDVLLTNEKGVKESKAAVVSKQQTIIDLAKGEIDRRNGILQKIDEEAPIIRCWNLYMEMVGKNGICKIALRQALPFINNEINRILEGVCDFDVKVDMDANNAVMINMERDGVAMDLKTACSGFESTLSSIALRIALGNIGSMPKPSFIVLDEILSGINHENVSKIKDLYKRILGGYDFILHIVHDDIYEDMHDMEVRVVKEDNISHIEVL